jgi:hypothetical protein
MKFKPLLLTFFLLFFSACAKEVQTFYGYQCQDNCSGHESGYAWAKKNKVGKEQDCLSFSQSFQEGCSVYLQQKTPEISGKIPENNDVTQKSSENLVVVKYRKSNPVNVSPPQFQSISPNQPTVKKVYYDVQNQYLIIRLRGVHYHYCKVPEKIWELFSLSPKKSDELYKNTIKGNFDCRNGGVPSY